MPFYHSEGTARFSMQDEALLAERYLDGTIDALDLLLCADSCSADAPSVYPKHRQTCPDAKTSKAGALPSRAASTKQPDQDTQTGAEQACSMPAGIPRRNAGRLTYDDFVLQYMAPNLPVLIQVDCTLSPSIFCTLPQLLT